MRKQIGAAGAFAVVFLTLLVPGAGGQESQVLTFGHDESREITSGLYGGDPASGDALAARHPNTYETAEVTVPEGTRHSYLSAAVSWADERVNLDVYVYRLDADGHAVAPAVARAATTGRASDTAVYAPAGSAVEPGRYLVVVDNVCSRDLDDDPRFPGTQPVNCGAGDPPDEDDFSATVALGNQLPTVTLTGPDTTPAKSSTDYEAVADDPDGTILSYLFDLDGDGVYELDSDGMAKVPVTFASRGPRTIGVQVLDDSGAAAIATKTVQVTRAVKKPDTREPLTTFKLSRKAFGGAAKRRLVVSYRLREKARVDVKLRRRGKTVRLIGRGVRKANRNYRIVLRPSHLRRGVYTVRISVAAASGKKQVEERKSRRR